MKIRVVIVSPKYQQNLGYIARVSKNFGIDRLRLVVPRTNVTGATAIKYSKHARDLLENALIYDDFASSVADCKLVIGTTGIWRKAKTSFRNILLPDELSERLNKLAYKDTNVALVIGRDDIGLTKEELEACNLITYVPTNPKYPILNISHALGILLFSLTQSNLGNRYKESLKEVANPTELNVLFKMLDSSVENNEYIRNKVMVKNIFRRVFSLSQPTKNEVHALMTLFGKNKHAKKKN